MSTEELKVLEIEWIQTETITDAGNDYEQILDMLQQLISREQSKMF